MTHRFRKGDIVSITGKVRHDQFADEHFVMIDLDGYYQHISVAKEAVTLISARIDPGERVRWSNGREGEVIAADADKLWVQTANGYVTWPASEVEIVPAVELAAIEPPPMAPETVALIDADAGEVEADG